MFVYQFKTFQEVIRPIQAPLTHTVMTLTRTVWACHADDTPTFGEMTLTHTVDVNSYGLGVSRRRHTQKGCSVRNPPWKKGQHGPGRASKVAGISEHGVAGSDTGVAGSDTFVGSLLDASWPHKQSKDASDTPNRSSICATVTRFSTLDMLTPQSKSRVAFATVRQLHGPAYLIAESTSVKLICHANRTTVTQS